MPTQPHEIFAILRSMREDELVLAATQIGKAPGRLAWVELAQRKGYFQFDISVTSGEGRIDIECKARGAAAHDGVQYS